MSKMTELELFRSLTSEQGNRMGDVYMKTRAKPAKLGEPYNKPVWPLDLKQFRDPTRPAGWLVLVHHGSPIGRWQLVCSGFTEPTSRDRFNSTKHFLKRGQVLLVGPDNRVAESWYVTTYQPEV